ncbi:MAG: hypothetical protein UY87_C0036G0005 [Candidatus Peribacteria bacterium GW2011_GWC2_54_8]|nr:MAG: hypothetical protein UY87_C0036G0005 [Candidatus Peribacteria bacterium GW2011_GWC2_54_8]
MDGFCSVDITVQSTEEVFYAIIQKQLQVWLESSRYFQRREEFIQCRMGSEKVLGCENALSAHTGNADELPGVRGLLQKILRCGKHAVALTSFQDGVKVLRVEAAVFQWFPPFRCESTAAVRLPVLRGNILGVVVHVPAGIWPIHVVQHNEHIGAVLNHVLLNAAEFVIDGVPVMVPVYQDGVIRCESREDIQAFPSVHMQSSCMPLSPNFCVEERLHIYGMDFCAVPDTVLEYIAGVPPVLAADFHNALRL